MGKNITDFFVVVLCRVKLGLVGFGEKIWKFHRKLWHSYRFCKVWYRGEKTQNFQKFQNVTKLDGMIGNDQKCIWEHRFSVRTRICNDLCGFMRLCSVFCMVFRPIPERAKVGYRGEKNIVFGNFQNVMKLDEMVGNDQKLIWDCRLMARTLIFVIRGGLGAQLHGSASRVYYNKVHSIGS